jgi:hypothetical protein
MTEEQLLERLLVEATYNGRIMKERDDALATMENAGKALAATQEKLKHETHDLNNARQALRISDEARRRAYHALIELLDAATNYRAAVSGKRSRAERVKIALVLHNKIEAAQEVYNEEVPF